MSDYFALFIAECTGKPYHIKAYFEWVFIYAVFFSFPYRTASPYTFILWIINWSVGAGTLLEETFVFFVFFFLKFYILYVQITYIGYLFMRFFFCSYRYFMEREKKKKAATI